MECTILQYLIMEFWFTSKTFKAHCWGTGCFCSYWLTPCMFPLFCVLEWILYIDHLGPVHMYFWKQDFFLRFVLPSTRIRCFRSLKMAVFENALQSGDFWKRRFIVFVWMGKTEVFEYNDVILKIQSFPRMLYWLQHMLYWESYSVFTWL